MGGGGLEVGGGVPSEVRRLDPGQAGQGEVNEQFHLVRAEQRGNTVLDTSNILPAHKSTYPINPFKLAVFTAIFCCPNFRFLALNNIQNLY